VKKVELAIRGRGDSRLKDLEMMGVFQHTGANEVLNSLHIKVCLTWHFFWWVRFTLKKYITGKAD
jgi:hypothetical protein